MVNYTFVYLRCRKLLCCILYRKYFGLFNSQLFKQNKVYLACTSLQGIGKMQHSVQCILFHSITHIQYTSYENVFIKYKMYISIKRRVVVYFFFYSDDLQLYYTSSLYENMQVKVYHKENLFIDVFKFNFYLEFDFRT